MIGSTNAFGECNQVRMFWVDRAKRKGEKYRVDRDGQHKDKDNAHGENKKLKKFGEQWLVEGHGMDAREWEKGVTTRRGDD